MSVVKKVELKIKDNMTKEEEIEIIETLCNAFSKFPNNYLAGLFSEGLLNWVKRHIKDDLSCDIHINFVNTTLALEEARGKVPPLEKRIEELEEHVRQLKEGKEYWKKRYEEEGERAEQVVKERHELIDKVVYLQSRIHQLEQDLLQAKAKFYDYFFKQKEEASDESN